MRVKGSAFGGLQVRGVEETLTTSVTSGGKAGVWRKEEGKRKKEKRWERKKVDVQMSLLRVLLLHSYFLLFGRNTLQAIPRSKDPNKRLFLDS